MMEIKSMVDIGKDELGSGAQLSPFRLPMYEVEGQMCLQYCETVMYIGNKHCAQVGGNTAQV